MIAGQDATFSNNLDDVYRYDIALDQWTQLNLEIFYYQRKPCGIIGSEDMDMVFIAIEIK